MLLGIDPGDTTGWASSTQEGVLVDMGQVKLNDLHGWLDGLTNEFTVIVLENFKMRPGTSFPWSEMNTIQVIGAIKYRAYQLGCRVVLQEPSVKSIGYKWAGVSVPKNHNISHQADAWAHLTYYSHKVLKNQIPVARRKSEEK